MTVDTTTEDAGTDEVRRIDPARCACVLIGVDRYSELEPLRSVRHNLTELAAALTDKAILGIAPERITTVANPESAVDLVAPIREAAKAAADTLIVYYAGHGLLDRSEEELYLTLPGSVEDQPETAVSDAYIRRAMRDHGSAERRVLLLDCCYSGRVLRGGMSVADRGVRASGRTLRGVRGAYVMTSTSGDRKSHAPDPKRCTAFTGELVGVLREGVPDGPEMLGLHAVFEAVRDRMAERRLPQPQEPQDRDEGGVGLLPFVRNVAVAPPPTAAVAAPAAPPARPSRRLLAAGALALGLVAGLAAPPAWQWVRGLNPQQPGGACSPRATLLSYSDALDKRQASGETIGGLSALALTGPGRALALTDNQTGRVFPLRLGPPEKLRPEALTAKTLRTQSGTKPSEWFDGEGLVVERGGKTILVASETGPAIRRFSMATGTQVGRDLPVPPEFRTSPKGQGQAGRTIESLTVSPDGRYLYAAMEGALAKDGDARGRTMLRIQRYVGTPGGAYAFDRQYAYQAKEGMYLAELVASADDRLLALERQYVDGIGNAVRVYDVPLKGAQPMDESKALYDQPADVFVEHRLLFDLGRCPAGDPGVVPTHPGRIVNPLLENVEGMALGEPWTTGPHKGRRPLYLVSDDNNNSEQTTRLYALSVRIP
ncbi:esterase-like activity of phytase family protein [Streptomyces sp. NPDC048506]|uniref:caspase, EACC1-associated type n=1 Tax=Streptomyces sp. NPDC048506 TaxID=3155028 RepID=UPI0034149AF3